MYIDSHCHLDFPDLVGRLDEILHRMQENSVDRALCVSVNLQDFPQVLALAEKHPHLYASVGIHPDYPDVPETTVEELVRLSLHPKIVAIGETGLDYYRLTGDLDWQRERFRIHIRAAVKTQKPLIIHTRSSSEDTIRLMQEEGASQAGGVMHCFTESWEIAEAAMAMGFYISFSGIVTFKSAKALKEVAQKMPLDRMLIETDSPYLAPVPFRGKINEPGYVRYVAEEIARLRQCPVEDIAEATSANFLKLFKIKEGRA
jgi:TatD DNase family protein